MASITIRNLDDDLKVRLRLQAARHGRSMEDEARHILRHALAEEPSALSLVEAIRRRVEPVGGVQLPDLPRDPIPAPPTFRR